MMATKPHSKHPGPCASLVQRTSHTATLKVWHVKHKAIESAAVIVKTLVVIQVITIHNHMNYSNICNNGDTHLVRTVKERGNRPVPTSGWRSCSADGYGSELFPPIVHGSSLHDGEYSGNV